MCAILYFHFTAVTLSRPPTIGKSQIDHSDMYHVVSGINSRIHSVSLASHVSTHLLIHLSAHLYYHHHSHHPSVFHSRLKADLFNKSPSHLKTPSMLDCFHDHSNGTDVIMLLD